MIALDFQSAVPLVAQIEEQFRRRIEGGSLRIGAKLPSVRRLAKDCGVSTATVVEAYNRLVARGLIDARRASGYFICFRADPVRSRAPSLPGDLAIDSYWMLRQAYEDVPFAVRPGCGWLPEDWLFEEGVRAGLRAASRISGSNLVRYGTPQGYLPLRQLLQNQLLARGIAAGPDQIVLTHGASHALSLLMQLLVKPGDAVLIDDPGYCNLISSLKQYGATLLGVPRTSTGVDAQALERLAAEFRPKVFFTNTCLQNPTGTNYSAPVAHRVLQIAEKYDFHIVEDDIFGELQAPYAPSLAGLDELRRVTCVQSFSKTISPSLRVGYLACPPDIADGIIQLKMLHGLTSSEISERMVFAILTEGHHRRHLEGLRERLAKTQESVCDRLEQSGLRIFHRPNSGLFVWAGFDAPVDTQAVTQAAAQEGIMLAPGSLFRVRQDDVPWFRFNVAHCLDPALYRFLEQASAAR